MGLPEGTRSLFSRSYDVDAYDVHACAYDTDVFPYGAGVPAGTPGNRTAR
ncbi:hypothetical protein [Streptomyces kanamyceticus]|nr:hypothetical protein [Streptomyces kanamyceticus]